MGSPFPASGPMRGASVKQHLESSRPQGLQPEAPAISCLGTCFSQQVCQTVILLDADGACKFILPTAPAKDRRWKSSNRCCCSHLLEDKVHCQEQCWREEKEGRGHTWREPTTPPPTPEHSRKQRQLFVFLPLGTSPYLPTCGSAFSSSAVPWWAFRRDQCPPPTPAFLGECFAECALQ